MNLKLTMTSLSLITCLGMNSIIAGEKDELDKGIGLRIPNIAQSEAILSNTSSEFQPSNTTNVVSANSASSSTASNSMGFLDYLINATAVNSNRYNEKRSTDMILPESEDELAKLTSTVIYYHRSGNVNLAKEHIDNVKSHFLRGKLFIEVGLFTEAFEAWQNAKISPDIAPKNNGISSMIYDLSYYDLGVAAETAAKAGKIGSAFAFLNKILNVQYKGEIMQKVVGFMEQKGS